MDTSKIPGFEKITHFEVVQAGDDVLTLVGTAQGCDVFASRNKPEAIVFRPKQGMTVGQIQAAVSEATGLKEFKPPAYDVNSHLRTASRLFSLKRPQVTRAPKPKSFKVAVETKGKKNPKRVDPAKLLERMRNGTS